MILTDEQIKGFEYLFEGVRYIPNSHTFEHQHREDRTRERFELQFFLKETNQWSRSVWFQIWIEQRSKKVSVMYSDNRDVYGFAKLNEIDHEGIKILDWLTEYAKNHPDIRLLLLLGGWEVRISPLLQRALDGYRRKKGNKNLFKDKHCVSERISNKLREKQNKRKKH